MARQARVFLTQGELQDVLNNLGVSVRWNVIKNDYEITPTDWKRDLLTEEPEMLNSLLWECLRARYAGVTMQNIDLLLSNIAHENRINPPLQAIQETAWDGVDRFASLYRIMNIPADDTLSRTLIKKWFWQGASLLQNSKADPFGADGVLVLQGAAGYGKTLFFNCCAMKPKFFKEGGRISEYDKDHERRDLTAWITELGELERTLTQKNFEAFKAFVTNSIDCYRLPYARKDVEAPRRTNLGATCNGTEFIIDEGVSRRCWTIPITQKMDIDGLLKFDFQQLWAQALTLSQADLQGYRLTNQEREDLAGRNLSYTEKLPAQAEIEDIVSEMLENDPEAMTEFHTTATQFKRDYYPVLKNYTAQQITKAFVALGFEYDREHSFRLDGIKACWILSTECAHKLNMQTLN